MEPPGVSAVQAVLCTTEMLEAILLQLDMASLLVSALRVSRRWNSLITNSPSLQRALFFQPMQRPQGEQGTGEFKLNPLLVEKFGPLFFDSVSEQYGYLRRAHCFFALPWTPTAGREVDLPDQRAGHDQVLRYSTRPLGVDTLDAESVAKERALRRPFTRKGASWRRMLVSQPPPCRLGYIRFDVLAVQSHDGFFTCSQASRVVVHPDRYCGRGALTGGLRMGVLYDVVQQTIGEPEGVWHWCRVLWGQLREPFYNEHCRETCRKLLSETGVAMEFHWRDLDYHASCLNLSVLDF
jgi:hypothetical protein